MSTENPQISAKFIVAELASSGLDEDLFVEKHTMTH